MTKTPEELTKDWKEGKLKSGLYWVNFKEKIVIAECTVFGDVSRPFEIEIKTDFMIKISKVLAPVPTYDEYKAMQDQIADASKKVEGLEEEINQWQKAYQNTVTQNCSVKNECARLRALLRECKNIVAHDCWQEAQFPDGQVVERQDLLTRINAALGESEEQ